MILDCQVCKEAKSQVYPVAQHSTRESTAPLELVHMDVIGPFPNSHAHNRYALIMVDEYSRFVWLYVLRKKSEVCTTIKKWAKMI